MSFSWNPHFNALSDDYLFVFCRRAGEDYKRRHPNRPLLSLGIGDVTRPLPSVVVDAMKLACEEMGDVSTFRGYPPDGGYPFLKDAICRYYKGMGIRLDREEVFVSDGAKSDLGGVLDLIGDTPILIPDPVYPVVRDAALLAGKEVWYIPLREEEGFCPSPEGLPTRPFLIYLCSPNNPTGVAYTKETLGAWIRFCKESGSLILYDAAYSAFVTRGGISSIYEIRGAERYAIEVGSFSKMAGFTGVRCAWSVFPKALDRDNVSPKKLWERRQGSRFNGVGYVVSRGAEAALSPAGRVATQQNVAYYRENAQQLASCLSKKGIPFFGGQNAPYLWIRAPRGMSSRQGFSYLLEEGGILTTPGSGFGHSGEGYLRLSAFASHEDTDAAVKRLFSLSYPVSY